MWLPAFLLALLLVGGARESSASEARRGDMVIVPAGEFLMGDNDGNADEAPAHRVYLDAYYIDRHEVTNAAFAEFVRASRSFDAIEGTWFRYSAEGCRDIIAHYKDRHGVAIEKLDRHDAESDEERQTRQRDVPRWQAALSALRAMPGSVSDAGVQELIKMQAAMPVRGVTWRDAAAYARWAGKRLPSEAEWEKAARGPDGRAYPWGSTWDPKRCRASLDSEAGPVAVDSHADGAGPYGSLQMAGNVWEWVADWYGENYYAAAQGRMNPKGPDGLPDGRLPGPSTDTNLLRSARQGRESDTRKVIRGGAWSSPEPQARFNTRCTRRLWSNPSYSHPDVGFRCARDAR